MPATSSEVSLYDTLLWAEEQAQHLSSASQHHVLLYLTINAFRRDDNPEGAPIGQVLAGRSTNAQIAFRTGLHPNTVSKILRELQEQAYIISDIRYGRGKTMLHVLWTPEADTLRAEIRAGARALPKGFRRPPVERKKTPLRVVSNVVGIN